MDRRDGINQSVNESIVGPSVIGADSVIYRPVVTEPVVTEPTRAERRDAINQSINDSVIGPSVIGTEATVLRPVRPDAQKAQPTIVHEIPLRKREQKTLKKLRLGICCSGFCILFFLFMAIGMPIILESVLKSQASNQAVMSRDTQKIWSKVPGQSETEFVRSFAFFNFSNWEDFYFHGTRPVFQEIQGYQIIEEQEDFDIEWLENDEKVRFKYWLHFKDKKSSRNLNETVHVINAGPLGFWYQLKNANKSQTVNNGLGLLFTNLQTIIRDVVISQGIAAQYFSSFEACYQLMLQPADISLENSRLIWDDITYGLWTQDNYQPWVIAARKSVYSEEAQKLGAYFGLTTPQLTSVMQYLSGVVSTISSVSFDNFYCNGGQNCSGFHLAARQIATSGVTNSTPPVKGIDPTITLCMKNRSCEGSFPEISSYYQKVFRPQNPGPEFDNITFPAELAEKWFFHSKEGNKRQDCLLHAGNLEAIFENGTLFDQTKNQKYLTNIRQRFGNLTRGQGVVLWEWLKFYLDEFITKKSKGGTSEQVGMSLVGSDWFFKSYAKTQDNLYNLLLQYKLLNLTALSNCQRLMYDSILNVEQKSVDNLCKHYDPQKPQTMRQFIYVCLNKFNSQWNMFKDIGDLTDYQMETFCDAEDPNGFGRKLQEAQVYLKNWYRCQFSPNGYCSAYEVAVKQWANSSITLNPIPEMAMKFKKSTTVKDWLPDVRAFEYGHFVSKYPNKKLQTFTSKESCNLLNWNGIFTLFEIHKILLANTTDQTPQQYGITDLENFKNYLRYVVVFVTFGGFVQQRTPYQLIFGYEDPLLAYFKNDIDPCRGGDPSIPSVIHFNDQNISKEEAKNNPIEMWTGKGNRTRLGYFSKINGVNWINFKQPKWNGNETFEYLKNPWAQKDILEGTDGKQNAPNQFQVNNLNIFIPNLLRHGGGKASGDTTNMYGIKIFKGAIDDRLYNSAEEDPANAKYYATFHGTLNLTSLNGFPVFMSKNHFKDTSKNWSQLVELWDEKKTFIYEPCQWDDSYINYEPYTGVTFSAMLFLQSSYYHSPDKLFSNINNSYMLPMFSINRGGNFSEAGAKKVFGLLKAGLTMKKVSLWLGIVMSVLLVGVLVFLVFRYKKVKARPALDEAELLISMQQPAVEEVDEQKSRDNI